MVAAVVVVVAAAAAAAVAVVTAAALGTRLLVGPLLIHPAGIYRFAVVSWSQCYKKHGNGVELKTTIAL